MVLTIEVTLALLVLIGSGTMVWGAHYFRISSHLFALMFAITAISWIAFLIATISLTVRTLILSHA